MFKYLAGIEYSTLFAGITLANIQSVLSTIMLAISCVVGIVNLCIMVKSALEDGKITKEEEELIERQLEELHKLADRENNNDRNNEKH